MISLEPLGERVVLQKIKEDNPMGFTIPDDPNDNRAKVVAVNMYSTLEPGNIVIVGKYSGTEINMDKETYYVIKEEDILARLNYD